MGGVRQCPSATCALLTVLLLVGAGTSSATPADLAASLQPNTLTSESSSSASSAAAVVGVAAHLKQLLLAPLQLPGTIVRTSFEKNVLYGVTVGTVRGVGRTFVDVAQGTVGALTAAFSSNGLGLGSSVTSLLGTSK